VCATGTSDPAATSVAHRVRSYRGGVRRVGSRLGAQPHPCRDAYHGGGAECGQPRLRRDEEHHHRARGHRDRGGRLGAPADRALALPGGDHRPEHRVRKQPVVQPTRAARGGECGQQNEWRGRQARHHDPDDAQRHRDVGQCQPSPAPRDGTHIDRTATASDAAGRAGCAISSITWRVQVAANRSAHAISGARRPRQPRARSGNRVSGTTARNCRRRVR